MAGFWPYSFLYVHGPRCSPTPPKRIRTRSSHLDQTSLVNKGFIASDTKNTIFLLRRASDAEQTRQSHLAQSGRQSQSRICVILVEL